MADSFNPDDQLRLQYLQAMEIDVWVERDELNAEDVLSEADIQAPHTSDAVPSPDWRELAEQVTSCQRCELCRTRTQTVFGAGNQNADWMFVGEAPGQNEDLAGEPFVGKAGQLLTEMIRALGLLRDDVYIANVIKCRPPNNRDPRVNEVESCIEYLKQQIALVKPKIILAVGRVAAQNLLASQDSLAKLRGVAHQIDNTPLIVIYHPAYLLRSLLEKRKAWDDLQFALKTYNNNKD